MNISIFGLGYVGCVSAGCLAEKGHNVLGVDSNPSKVAKINQGEPTIIEAGIADIIRRAVVSGTLRATMSVEEAVTSTCLSIIAVGTPGLKTGHLDLSHVERVCKEIGTALRQKAEFHVIVIRSTVLPGTNRRMAAVIAEASGKADGTGFAVVSNPEFIREGSAVQDFFHPPFTLFGSDNQKALDAMSQLYSEIDGEKVTSAIEVAEILKYVNNTFHALKVVFGNEVGIICKALGIDSHEVMDIFVKDTSLNLSSYYLKPGFAYGGSCLPKDTYALRTLANDHYLEIPVISNISVSNEAHKKSAIQMVLETGKRNIGILGLSFKEGTDDLRNSAIVDVVESLLGKGCKLRIFDRNVWLSELTGVNKDFIESKIPHIYAFVFDDIDSVIEMSDVIVVANREEEFKVKLMETRYADKKIIDLVRLWKNPVRNGNYEGIGW
jgi:GDP-mannose 6-dehydrogenase